MDSWMLNLDLVREASWYLTFCSFVLFSRLIKEFDRVAKDEAGHTDPDTTKMLHERKQSMVLLLKIVKIRRLMHIPVLIQQHPLTRVCLVLQIKELNSFVALKKQ
jgi:hypothetical protein